MEILTLQDVKYSYDKTKKVLRGIDAQMESGKMYAILGPSGCGKTTLLSLLGGLDSPPAEKSFLTGQILSRSDWDVTVKNTFRLFFRAIT